MKKIFLAVLAFLVPTITMAQVASGPITGSLTNADDIVRLIIKIFNIAIYLLISFAVLYLVYYIVQYFIKGDSDSKKEVGMNIGYGILGLFIILSIWGLVSILVGTFKLGGNNQLDTNRIPTTVIPN